MWSPSVCCPSGRTTYLHCRKFSGFGQNWNAWNFPERPRNGPIETASFVELAEQRLKNFLQNMMSFWELCKLCPSDLASPHCWVSCLTHSYSNQWRMFKFNAENTYFRLELQRLGLLLHRDEDTPNIIEIGTSQKFLSKVTHFLAVGRMQLVEMSLTATYMSDMGLGYNEKPLTKKFWRMVMPKDCPNCCPKWFPCRDTKILWLMLK